MRKTLYGYQDNFHLGNVQSVNWKRQLQPDNCHPDNCQQRNCQLPTIKLITRATTNRRTVSVKRSCKCFVLGSCPFGSYLVGSCPVGICTVSCCPSAIVRLAGFQLAVVLEPIIRPSPLVSCHTGI